MFKHYKHSECQHDIIMFYQILEHLGFQIRHPVSEVYASTGKLSSSKTGELLVPGILDLGN